MPWIGSTSVSKAVARTSAGFFAVLEPILLSLASASDIPHFEKNLQHCELESIQIRFKVVGRSHGSFHSTRPNLRRLFCHSLADVRFLRLLSCPR
jgi:hypothetical protein